MSCDVRPAQRPRGTRHADRQNGESKSMKTTRGFTLVEIMIVVAIIGLLAAIAIPNFVKARENAQMNSIYNNLRILEGAKDQWALEQKKGTGAAVTFADIAEYLKGG